MKKFQKLAALGLMAAAIFSANYSVHAEQKTNINLWPKAESPIKDSAEFNAKLESILQKMTLEEKVGQIMQAEIQTVTPDDIKKYHLGSVLNGGGSMPNRIDNAQPKDWVDFLDALYVASMDTSDGKQAIPIFWGTDAVHGHNNLTGATLFPHNIGLGAMNNADLIRQIGAATAKEVRATGTEWVFAPTLAVAQNDRWGRTYESYSEDPALVAKYATAIVEGLQGKPNTNEFLADDRVIATAKHFLADGGTEGGDDQGNARINEKELVKIHNTGYVPALDAGVQTVMASFSEWNGEKMHGNKYLLTDVLKNRMGFDGLVVGDWNGHGQVPGCTNDSCPQAINVAGVANGEPQDINLYVRRPLQPWHIFIENYERQQILSGAFAALPKGDVKVQTADKDVQEDALTFAWKDTWRAGLTLESGEPLDLTAHMKTGVLAVDIKINELAKGGVSFKMECQKENCDRVVPFTLPARDLVGKGWQKVYVPLSCFAQATDNFSATTMPFALEVGGAGEVGVANVQLLIQTPKNVALVSCPDYKTVSVTPDLLNEWWSIDWWLPRHQQKIADAKAIYTKGGKIDLLFIGDSITQSWEKEGVDVWKKHFASHNAFGIGFGGDRTENVLWRLQHNAVDGMKPKVAVLMIGTNNTGHRHENPQTTAAGIKKILEELQQRLPTTKILLLAIFPRDETPDGKLRKINNDINEIIKHYDDNQRVFFANVNSVFLTKDGVLPKDVMPDLLHPNEKGYELLAKALEPHLKKLLK